MCCFFLIKACSMHYFLPTTYITAHELLLYLATPDLIAEPILVSLEDKESTCLLCMSKILS